jgi:antitoxin MazE
MDLQVTRWGNSLAMRLPAEVARRLGVREGDTLQARLTTDGAMTVRAASWNRRDFAAGLAAARDGLPEAPAVIRELRDAARF